MADASEGKLYSFAYLCSMTLGVLLLPGGLFLLPIFQPITGSQEDDGGGSGRQPEQNDSDQFARRAGSMCASQPRVFDRHMASAARNFTMAHIAAPYCGRLVYSYFVPRNEGLATLVPFLEESTGLSHLVQLRAQNKWPHLSVIVTIGGHEEHIQGLENDIDLLFLSPVYTRSTGICPINPAKRVRFFNQRCRMTHRQPFQDSPYRVTYTPRCPKGGTT
ncbi:hypothetical protein MRX96_058879 [Rhipicephalus microplus]